MLAMLLPLFLIWHTAHTASFFDDACRRPAPVQIQPMASVEPTVVTVARRDVLKTGHAYTEPFSGFGPGRTKNALR